MNQNDMSLQSKDGLNLYFQNWAPDEDPLGVICIVHGLGEHCERYGHVAEFFISSGFGVTAFDLRGHGKIGDVVPASRGHQAVGGFYGQTGKDVDLAHTAGYGCAELIVREP